MMIAHLLVEYFWYMTFTRTSDILQREIEGMHTIWKWRASIFKKSSSVVPHGRNIDAPITVLIIVQVRDMLRHARFASINENEERSVIVLSSLLDSSIYGIL